jgi:hypothetical protein
MNMLSRRGVSMSLALVLALLAITFNLTPVAAQEATPEAGPSLLEGLGLPVLEVTVTVEGLTLPAEIAAGPVLVIAHNETDGFALVDLAQFPEGVSLDDWLAIGDGALPEWTADAVVAGSAEVPPMASGSLVVNLAPGEWTVVADAEAEVAGPSAALTVTGEAVDADIAADFDLDMGAYVFNFPDTMAAGPQIWHVVNSHTVPHHAIIFPVDRPYTADEVAAGVMAEFSGTPAAEGFSFASSTLGPPMGVPVITGGQEFWVEAVLEPGFYVALCFISDPGSDVPHVMQGMVDTFEVTGG